MTKQEFETFIESAKGRGFTHVKTGAGYVPLDLWRPYGCFDGCNPGIEAHIGGFEWIGPDTAADYFPHGEDYAGPGGVWTFSGSIYVSDAKDGIRRVGADGARI